MTTVVLGQNMKQDSQSRIWGSFWCRNAKQPVVSGSESLSARCVTLFGHAHTLLMLSSGCCLTRDGRRFLCLWVLCRGCTLRPAGPALCAQRARERRVWRGYGPNEFFPYAPNIFFPLVQGPSTVVWAVRSSWRRGQWGLAGSLLLPLALRQIVGSGRPRGGSKTR